jgi:hypothetical protein
MHHTAAGIRTRVTARVIQVNHRSAFSDMKNRVMDAMTYCLL